MSRHAVETAIDLSKAYRNKTWEAIAAMMRKSGIEPWRARAGDPEGKG